MSQKPKTSPEGSGEFPPYPPASFGLHTLSVLWPSLPLHEVGPRYGVWRLGLISKVDPTLQDRKRRSAETGTNHDRESTRFGSGTAALVETSWERAANRSTDRLARSGTLNCAPRSKKGYFDMPILAFGGGIFHVVLPGDTSRMYGPLRDCKGKSVKTRDMSAQMYWAFGGEQVSWP
jgi:hypothetical protein